MVLLSKKDATWHTHQASQFHMILLMFFVSAPFSLHYRSPSFHAVLWIVLHVRGLRSVLKVAKGTLWRQCLYSEARGGASVNHS